MNATRRFAAWCGRRNIDELSSVQPFHVGGFIKDLQAEVSPPTVKQHVAALRMLFDWLVTGHVIDVNPAHAVRAPKYVVKKGKTPVLAANGSACMRRAARSMTFPAITISIIFRDNSCRYKRSGPCLVPKQPVHGPSRAAHNDPSAAAVYRHNGASGPIPARSCRWSCLSPQMIFSNYREIVTPEAERHWQIFPPATVENVVPMAQLCQTPVPCTSHQSAGICER
jgi:hypothetical protein